MHVTAPAPGRDHADLGAGDDLYTDTQRDRDTVAGGAGDDTVFGGGGNDRIFGGQGADALNGGDGDDRIFGHAQDDWLRGGDGDDTLLGGTGDDTVVGSAGADSLAGGSGDDLLTGGTQADRFVFAFGHGTDRVTDFEDGVDILDLTVWPGLTDFSQLTVQAGASGSEIFVTGDTAALIVLEKVAADLIDASDFAFA